MKRLLFLCLFFCGSMTALEAQQKLNVIYILADDLGYHELGSYGNTFNETPNLDKMAAAGVRLKTCYTAAPVCSPYRAALMTGKYPARLKITDYLRPKSAQHLDTAEITLPEMLHKNGYHTGIVGKWHLSGYVREGASEETLPQKHGFDEVMLSENKGIGEGTYFYPYAWNPDIKKKLADKHEFLIDRQNEEAMEFIDRNKQKPFFLYLSYYGTHTSLHGKPEIVEHFRRKNGAGTSPASKKNPGNDPYKKWPKDYQAKTNNPHLAAQLFSIDEGIGKIFAKLKSLGLDKNTIVIFTSDNGGETTITQNTPLKGGKSMLYEGGVTVPFIIWKPGMFPQNKTLNTPVCNYDFYPTIQELTNSKPNSQKVDGISIASLLKNPEKKTPERSFYWHYPLDKPHFLGGRSSGSMRKGDWKLIEFFDDRHVELYNLKTDISEKHNMAGTEKDRVKTLQSALANWRKSVGASN